MHSTHFQTLVTELCFIQAPQHQMLWLPPWQQQFTLSPSWQWKRLCSDQECRTIPRLLQKLWAAFNSMRQGYAGITSPLQQPQNFLPHLVLPLLDVGTMYFTNRDMHVRISLSWKSQSGKNSCVLPVPQMCSCLLPEIWVCSLITFYEKYQVLIWSEFNSLPVTFMGSFGF